MCQEKSRIFRTGRPLHLTAPLIALLLFGSVNPDPYPKDYFRSPLGIPLVLAGSFGEMRSNHFHSGLDMKTNGSTGYRVYAAADGWIARVSIAPGGFGNALYVEHPNGYMTVYAHLAQFSEEIESYIRGLQYEREQFAVDAFPIRGQFPVVKGDVIALSGNSGSSAGPHLHFEIRNVENGWPENPLLFGLEVPDTQAPRIQRVKLYALDDDSHLRIRDTQTGGWRTIGGRESVILDATLSRGVYRFTRADRIEAAGRIGFGLQTFDNHDGSTNRLGAFQVGLTVDGTTLFASKMESFSFGQTRFVNAHVDYAEYVRNRRWIERSFLLPGNRLPFYDAVDRGLLKIEAERTYSLEYRVSDAYGNEAVLPFALSGIVVDEELSRAPVQPDSSHFFVVHDQAFRVERPGFTARMPEETLYDDAWLSYAVDSATPSNTFGPVHRFHDEDTAVNEAYTMTLDASGLPEDLVSKASLATVSDGGRLAYAGGSYRDGVVTGSVRAFGAFTIATDTAPPTISPINISDGKDMRRAGDIRIRVRDDFSGVSRYRGEVDGKWILFEYDAKYGLLTHTFDGHVGAGSHALRLEVEDRTGNVRVYRTRFTL